MNLSLSSGLFLAKPHWPEMWISHTSLKSTPWISTKSRYHSFSGSGKDQKMTVNLAGVGKPTDRVEEAEKNILDIQKIQIPFFLPQNKKTMTGITEQHPQFTYCKLTITCWRPSGPWIREMWYQGSKIEKTFPTFLKQHQAGENGSFQSFNIWWIEVIFVTYKMSHETWANEVVAICYCGMVTAEAREFLAASLWFDVSKEVALIHKCTSQPQVRNELLFVLTGNNMTQSFTAACQNECQSSLNWLFAGLMTIQGPEGTEGWGMPEDAGCWWVAVAFENEFLSTTIHFGTVDACWCEDLWTSFSAIQAPWLPLGLVY